MMSMKEEGKPVSFVEDCAVPLEHLAEYTERLTEMFEKHGTRGTWYAHASVGCLHVRPVLNLRLDKDVQGDARHRRGGLRDGARIQGLAFRRARRRHRALGIPRADVRRAAGARLRGGEGPLRSATACSIPARSCARRNSTTARYFRYGPDYRGDEIDDARSTGRPIRAPAAVSRARSRCATTTAPAATLAGGVMCPSYRVTRDERDVTRGRANTLRLAITGQLGPDALTSDEMAETLKLCVSCKACRRECPTGVDMARMKIEVLAARAAKHGLSLHDRLVGYLPRYAPYAAQACRGCSICATRCRAPRQLSEAHRRLQRAAQPAALAHAIVFRDADADCAGAGTRRGREVVLFADTFNRYFERENLDAALDGARGRRLPRACRQAAPTASRPLCCGRTFLSVGAGRRGAAARPSARSRRSRRSSRAACRSSGSSRAAFSASATKFPALIKSDDAQRLAAQRAAVRGIPGARGGGRAARRCRSADRPARAAARPLPSEIVRRDGRGRDGAASSCPGSRSRPSNSSCCGMAGSFGYGAETIDVSLAMGELSLLPAVRKARGRCASSSPTAPPAGIRSTTAPAARRCMSRACWR